MTLLFQHKSVLLEQCIEALNIQPYGVYLDATVGGGGHSAAILKAHPTVRLLGIDRDLQAIQAAQIRLKEYSDRVQLFHGSFAKVLSTINEPLNGILFDLGVSSPQLDNADRGFSFQKDGPLDMRMNPEEGISAAELIEQSSEKEIADILYLYGEEHRSRRIARAIVQNRPFKTTLALAACIRKASGYKNSRTDPATRSFQALRIFVNQELEQLKSSLPLALTLLCDQGRLAVISFHSLEDRIVKTFFRTVAGKVSEKDAYGNPVVPPQAKMLFKKGIAGKDQDPSNPRARSARLRVIEKLPTNTSQ